MIMNRHPPSPCLQVKCHQYWPESGSLGLDDITVTLIDTQELAYYTIRTFRVTKVRLRVRKNISEIQISLSCVV